MSRVGLRAQRASLIALLAAAAAGWITLARAAEAESPALDILPPWQNGANNDAMDRGLEFTIPEVDDMADFHGDVTDPKLVLYVGGNYFFAMAPLLQAFEAALPNLKGRLFWETIPPGRLVEQMKAGGVITVGNMTFRARPDAYFAGLRPSRG